jgi:hypothetical protein
MATVTKDFKVKNGIKVQGDANLDGSLYVGGPNATIDGSDIITADIITAGNGEGNENVTVSYDAETKRVTFVAAPGYTDEDVKTVLTGSTQTNISITEVEGELFITAENGVEDSTTDDLQEGPNNLYYTVERVEDVIADTTTDDIDEGSANLYYTDSRVRDAIDAGSGLSYNPTTGEFSADLGYGLQFAEETNKIEIDDTVVATDQDVLDAIEDHNVSTGVHGVNGDIVGTSDAQTLTNKTLGNDLDADGNTIVNLATPTQASDAATKAYVDSVAEGLHVHASVAAATEGPVNLATGGLLQIDGVQLVAGNRVLVKDQEAPVENGIYVVAAGAWTRAEDYDSANEIQSGDFVFVSAGTSYFSTGWVQINPVSTLGTDPIVWDQFSGAGTYLAGNGLELNGSVFEIDTDITATNDFVSGAVKDHSDLTTGVHGVSGDVVGTSDAQTLTNKTLGEGTALDADLDAVNEHKIVNLVNPSSDQDAATKKYVDDEISGVNDTIDGLTTTDINEGDNLYYTDARVKDVLTGSTQTNISITNVDGELIISAENGVDNSTTDDLAEGTSNLYFTDERAVDALEAVVPNFTAIEFNSVAQQVAATVPAPTTAQTVAYAFAKAEYRTAKFLVKVAYSTHTEVSEVLLTLDASDNIAITEFAIVSTNGSASAISAGINESSVELLVTPTNVSSTITVVGTLLA